MISAYFLQIEQCSLGKIQALKIFASPLQELDKLQSSTKQEVASAQDKVRPPPLSCHVIR